MTDCDLPDQGKPAPHPFDVPTAGDFHCGRCGTLLDGGTDEPVAARELRTEVEALRAAKNEWAAGYGAGIKDSAQEITALQAELEALKAERDRAVETRENANAATLRAEHERDGLRADLFTPDEIKLMSREIGDMCDNAADGGSIPPVLWRQLANKLDRLALPFDEQGAR